ncbi:hypothetical protein COB57_01420 [Candidatus Peregrinibacteria bacterium]|nr:MAG: hypothetical protein COB57_01420 [Candidatus Peregrinibacteria bacterium]
MFYPLFAFIIVILSLVSSSVLSGIERVGLSHQLLSSNAALYAAENELESSLYSVKQLRTGTKENESGTNSYIRAFGREKDDSRRRYAKDTTDFLIKIVEKNISQSPEKYKDKYLEGNFDEFRLIDIPQKKRFTDIQFRYKDLNSTTQGIVLDLFVFPRSYFEKNDGTTINFGSVRNLSSKADVERNVERMMYRPTIAGIQGTSINSIGTIVFSELGDIHHQNESVILIKNLDSTKENYILRFKHLDQKNIEYLVQTGYSDNTNIDIQNQYVEVDITTETSSMFQRVKRQNRTFAPLQPELDFAFFSGSKVKK